MSWIFEFGQPEHVFLGGYFPAMVTLCITLKPISSGGNCVSGDAS